MEPTLRTTLVAMMAIGWGRTAAAAPITIDPGDAEVVFRLLGTPLAGAVGVQTVDVAAGSYALCIGRSCFRVDVDGAGLVSGPANDAMTFSGSTVMFRPSILVTIDPASADVGYRLPGTLIYNVGGLHTGRLVPGTSFDLCIESNCLPIDVHPDGTVGGGPTGRFDFSGATVTFRSVEVSVDPQAANVGFRIPGTSVYNVGGYQQLGLVPDTTMALCIEDTCVPFSVAADGTVAGAVNGAVSFVGSTLVLANVPATVLPESTAFGYRIPGSTIYNVVGEQSAVLIPDVRMRLCVDATCAPWVVPEAGEIEVVVGIRHFTVRIGPADLDGDGVSDDVDDCPADADPDQADLDGDLLGDVCDPDDDGDSVLDEVDNCPADADPDQADLDQDGLGDVCDPDDDGDSVLDEADDCPAEADPDQADLDGDLLGDVCDPDDDGDSVLDEADECPVTPLDAIVDPSGCDGYQEVDLTCGAEGSWKNHGQYVSCVAQAASDAVAAGLLTAQERADLVQAAAKP
jgi:hypothetical protein